MLGTSPAFAGSHGLLPVGLHAQELMEVMELCWDKKIYKETKTPIVKRTGKLGEAGKTEG
jgi:hypothetical protein